MAEQEREDFWGCVLTEKNKKFSWNGPSEANDDIAELDISHRLVLSQACLGPGAGKDDQNFVQATTLDAANNKVSVIVASIFAGSGATCPVHLTFSSPVSFELVQGSGPVHLSGNHIQVLSAFEMSDSDGSDNEADIGSSPKLKKPNKPEDKKPMKRDVAQVSKGPPTKKAKLAGESSSEESDSEDEEEEEEVKEKLTKEEKPKQTKEEKPKQAKEEKPEQAKEEAKPEGKKDQKTVAEKGKGPQKTDDDKKPGMTFADLQEESDSEDDEDFVDSEGDDSDSEDESEEDLEEDDNDDSYEGSSDEEDDSESEEETQPKAKGGKAGKKAEIANGKKKETPSKKTPQSKKTPDVAKTPVSAKTTPAAKKTPQGPADLESIKQSLLKTPNLPKKMDKFKNYMKSRFRAENDKMINEVWDWLQKNKK